VWMVMYRSRPQSLFLYSVDIECINGISDGGAGDCRRMVEPGFSCEVKHFETTVSASLIDGGFVSSVTLQGSA
jgi:hypothetical protein